MKISVVLTVFNEEGSIGPLVESLITQTVKPDEIVIVDGGSNDKTVQIISHYQKKDGRIKLLKEKCTRAKGRNLGVEIAKNQIIAITDAGCVVHKDWLENITKPFNESRVDISAGFYKMTGGTPVSKAMSVFLGVTPRRFDVNFLPSTRSMAFRKSAWEKVGGFPEGKGNSAEDTDFNYRSVKLGLKYSRVKTAVVEWGMPVKLGDFFYKIKEYAKWDARYGIWWHPTQRFGSHNIKALSILLRYLVGSALFVLSIKYSSLPFFAVLIFIYFFWAYRKIYLEFGDYKIAVWGPVLQVTSDIAVIEGLIIGLKEGKK
jgi:glycosyltransferase involved in cell wall biosynthesis